MDHARYVVLALTVAVGCYGADALEDEQVALEASPSALPLPALCEVERRLSGEAPPANLFQCSAEPEELSSTEAPFYLGAGALCDREGESAWAALAIDSPMLGRVSLTGEEGAVALDVIDPEGVLVAVVSPEEPCIELSMGAGRWSLRASPLDPDSPPAQRHFELAVDYVDDL